MFCSQAEKDGAANMKDPEDAASVEEIADEWQQACGAEIACDGALTCVK